MCEDLAKYYHHCIRGGTRGTLVTSSLSKYQEPVEWPELRMREIVGVTLEPEASDLEKGEEEIAIRQRIRESLVLEVQASDLEDMAQFKKGFH